MSLVDLGKKLLEAARAGQDDEVRILMANGAPFTTDWVMKIFTVFGKSSYFSHLKKKMRLLQLKHSYCKAWVFLLGILQSHHLISN